MDANDGPTSRILSDVHHDDEGEYSIIAGDKVRMVPPDDPIYRAGPTVVLKLPPGDVPVDFNRRLLEAVRKNPPPQPGMVGVARLEKLARHEEERERAERLIAEH
jgi:hypothetical protein